MYVCVYVCMYVCVCVCVEVNNGNKSDSIKKKIETTKLIQKWWIYYNGKSMLNVSVLENLHQDFKMVKNVAWTIKHLLLFKQHFSPS